MNTVVIKYRHNLAEETNKAALTKGLLLVRAVSFYINAQLLFDQRANTIVNSKYPFNIIAFKYR